MECGGDFESQGADGEVLVEAVVQLDLGSHEKESRFAGNGGLHCIALSIDESSSAVMVSLILFLLSSSNLSLSELGSPMAEMVLQKNTFVLVCLESRWFRFIGSTSTSTGGLR